MELCENVMLDAIARFPDLEDRGVLITGGASGIGAALVEGFLRQKARVAFIDIDEPAAAALGANLAAKGLEPPVFIPADLRDADAIGAAVDAAAAATGPVGVLINNAARDDRHEFDSLTPGAWDESQAVNLRPHFFVTQAVVPYMRKLGTGSVINLSSIAYMLNMGDLPAYAAAKAAIIGLTKSMAGRLGPEGIRVNAVLPGMIVTERQRALWLSDETIAHMVERQCLKRTLGAGDLVGPCLYLASTCSSAMTAQTMIVDGGIL